MTTTTPLMSLVLPTPSTDLGPQWATLLNAALTLVDSHTHANGQGAKIPPSGINIISELTFNGNDAVEIRSVRLANQSATFNNAADIRALYVVNGDLYYVNQAGVSVQITSGGGLSFSSLGTIGGDFGQPGVLATAVYSNLTKTFSFLRESGKAADLYASGLSLAFPQAGALAVKLLTDVATVAYSLTLPIAAPTNDSVLTFDVSGNGTFRSILGTTGETSVSSTASAFTVGLPGTISKSLALTGNNTYAGTAGFSGAETHTGTESHTGAETHSGTVAFTGATSGRGIIPLGAVIATMPHLTGAYACVATTVADSNGFVQCAGQTIVDASSPMNGAVVPNINGDVFLRGNATSGTTAGANSVTLIEANLPAHTHTLNNASVPSSSHTHDMTHAHQFATNSYFAPLNNFAFKTDSSNIGLPFSGPSTFAFNEAENFASGGVKGMISNQASNRSYYTGGPLNASAASKNDTGTPSASQTISANNTGSGASFSVIPVYITARFCMRIK